MDVRDWIGRSWAIDDCAKTAPGQVKSMVSLVSFSPLRGGRGSNQKPWRDVDLDRNRLEADYSSTINLVSIFDRLNPRLKAEARENKESGFSMDLVNIFSCYAAGDISQRSAVRNLWVR
jgi:hypothetical protein